MIISPLTIIFSALSFTYFIVSLYSNLKSHFSSNTSFIHNCKRVYCKVHAHCISFMRAYLLKQKSNTHRTKRCYRKGRNSLHGKTSKFRQRSAQKISWVAYSERNLHFASSILIETSSFCLLRMVDVTFCEKATVQRFFLSRCERASLMIVLATAH